MKQIEMAPFQRSKNKWSLKHLYSHLQRCGMEPLFPYIRKWRFVGDNTYCYFGRKVVNLDLANRTVTTGARA